MKYIIIIFLFLYNLNAVIACDCKGLTVEESFNSSSQVVLGEIIKVEHKTYIIDKESKDSIQQRYERLVRNDTIHYVEYTVQVFKNYKDSLKTSELILRANADLSNCDLKLELGVTYLIYGYDNWWENLYYPKDKYFILSSICTRTTKHWKKEQEELEAYLREKN